MKPLRHIFLLLCIIAALFQPLRASAQPEYIRLHIVAESNTLHDQAIKLCVRDDIREYTSSLLRDCTNSGDAWQILHNHQDRMLTIARESAQRYGFDGSVAAELGVFEFPEKIYGDETVPAGEYRALRITLGQGAGRNWWCVLYPSLCLPETADTDKPIEFYSSILRWAIRTWEAIRK